MSALSGCAIAIFGRFPGYTQAKLKTLITENGAKFENGISSACTHLLVPDLTISSNDKVNAALEKKIPIVGLKWLTDSINEGKKLTESSYLHDYDHGKASSGEQIHSDMKKRKGGEPEETAENPTKKPRARDQGADSEEKRAVGQGALTDELAEEAETERRPKRGRDGLESEAQEPVKFDSKKRGRPTKNALKSGPEFEDIELEDADLKKDRKEVTGAKSGPRHKISTGTADTTETLTKEADSAGAQASLATRSGESTCSSEAKAKAKDIHVPVTPWCEQRSWCSVYIDPSGTPYDASLSQTNIGDGKNNNKYYNIQLLESRGNSKYATWTQWGRVGEEGQQALYEDKTLEEAMKTFEKKFREKTGLKWENRYDTPKTRKYTLIEKNYMDSEDEDGMNEKSERKGGSSGKKLVTHSTLSPELQSLMKLIFNSQHMASSMEDMRYNANKLPLGKLSKRTLSQGFLVLKDLDEILTNINLAQSKYKQPLSGVLEQLTSKYYTVIPHDFGRSRPPIIDNANTLKKEVELVEALSNMGITNEIMNDAQYPVDADGSPINPLDKQFMSLGLEKISLVEKSMTEYAELEAYFHKSQRHSIHAHVVDIFRITRPGEAERFENSGFSAKDVKKMHNVNDARKLLWHGSRSTNFGGILSQGLRIAPPEAPVNGYAFGKGIYLADVSSKSCEYVYPSTSGGLALLLLCEAQLGDPPFERHLHCSDAANQSKASGSLSTWAKGVDQPKGWKDASAISEEFKSVQMMDVNQGMYKPALPAGAWIPDNEYIVYSVAQVKLRYLFKVQFSYY